LSLDVMGAADKAVGIKEQFLPMRIAYCGGAYWSDSTSGGNAHRGQFITQVARGGHEVWTWYAGDHPDARCLPPGHLRRVLALRGMDVLYIRIEAAVTRHCSLGVFPYRQIIGNPVVAWEQVVSIPSCSRAVFMFDTDC